MVLPEHHGTTGATPCAEDDAVIAALVAIGPSLRTILGGSCEVVVHDLRVPERSIVGIVNGHVTGRSVGGPLIGGPLNDLGMRWIKDLDPSQTMVSYETMSRSGKRLRSTSNIFRNRENRPIAAFCINLDIDAVAPVASWLASLVDGVDPTQTPTNPQPQDVDQVLHATIEECFALLRYSANTRTTKHSRMAVVKELEKRGVFLVRGAVSQVAKRLSISKFTVYRYLDEVRGES